MCTNEPETLKRHVRQSREMRGGGQRRFPRSCRGASVHARRAMVIPRSTGWKGRSNTKLRGPSTNGWLIFAPVEGRSPFFVPITNPSLILLRLALCHCFVVVAFSSSALLPIYCSSLGHGGGVHRCGSAASPRIIIPLLSLLL